MGTICESVYDESCALPEPQHPVREDWRELYYATRIAAFESAQSYLQTNADGTALIDGPMGAGKSLFVLALGEYFEEQNLSVMYTRSWVDTRTDTIWSRTGAKHQDVTWRFEFEDDDVMYEPDVLIVEEAHFIGLLKGQEHFLDKLIEIIQVRRELGKRTIIAMLNEDYRREHWEAYNRVFQEIRINGGEEFELKAVCMECGEAAGHTHRREGGDALVEIGASEYEARCGKCHGVTVEP